MKAPGAYHHARWMGKIIYTLKIALLRKQVNSYIDAFQLNNIYNLAAFLCVYYVEVWFKAPLTSDAPLNDLNLHKAVSLDIESMKRGKVICQETFYHCVRRLKTSWTDICGIYQRG